MKQVLGIFRAACYSLGMVERDEEIMRAVMQRIAAEGYAIHLIHEEEFSVETPMPDFVFHMTRSPQSLDILQAWQKAGCRVINTIEGIQRVERASLAEWCAEQGIPTPKTWIVDTACNSIECVRTTSGENETITFPCWVKRTGGCAQLSEDVCCVTDVESYRQCLARFQTRGITRAVVMEHLKGPCIKFYAVRDSDFFYWIPADKLGYDKFLTSVSSVHHDACMTTNDGVCTDFRFPIPNAPLEVYGGDAIIDSNGVARLIDLNDWPSFSVCREKAADAIARLLL